MASKKQIIWAFRTVLERQSGPLPEHKLWAAVISQALDDELNPPSKINEEGRYRYDSFEGAAVFADGRLKNLAAPLEIAEQTIQEFRSKAIAAAS